MTDVIQVIFLIGGGLITTYIALDLIGAGDGVIAGFTKLCTIADDKFHLILDKSHPGHMDLPGVFVILGGLWVANLYYWGCSTIFLWIFTIRSFVPVLNRRNWLSWEDGLALLIVVFRDRTISKGSTFSIDTTMFKTKKSFNIMSCIIMAILIGFYWLWW